MPKASDMSDDDNVSILVKGPNGMGKTLLAASAAVFGPIHISYFDKSKPVELKKYFNNIIKRPDLLDNITYDVYGAYNVNEYLNQIFKWKAQGCRYVAVITDSLTFLTASAVGWSMGFRDPKGPDKDSMNSNSVQLIPDWDEYKIETSLVVQALDILTTIPTMVIWTAHPLPQVRIEGSGRNQVVTKSTSLVTYGNKVAGMVPGRFTEIYHLGKELDYNTNPTTHKYICYTDSVGDDFARSSLLLPQQIDWSNKLFFDVWAGLLKKSREGV